MRDVARSRRSCGWFNPPFFCLSFYFFLFRISYSLLLLLVARSVCLSFLFFLVLLFSDFESRPLNSSLLLSPVRRSNIGSDKTVNEPVQLYLFESQFGSSVAIRRQAAITFSFVEGWLPYLVEYRLLVWLDADDNARRKLSVC